jgi:hypothetical protein
VFVISGIQNRHNNTGTTTKDLIRKRSIHVGAAEPDVFSPAIHTATVINVRAKRYSMTDFEIRGITQLVRRPPRNPPRENVVGRYRASA